MKVMFKRLLCLTVVFVMLFALTACGAADDIKNTPEATQPPSTEPVKETIPVTEEPEETRNIIDGGDIDEPTNAPGNASDASWEITYKDSFFYTNDVEDNMFLGIVEVLNTSDVDLYLYGGTFNICNPNGDVMAYANEFSVQVWPNAIHPGERGYYFYNGSSLEYNTIVTSDMQYIFDPVIKLAAAENPITRFDVTAVALLEGEGVQSWVCRGTVTNNTEQDEDLPRLFVILYREDGTPMVASGHFMPALAAGASMEFEVDQWYTFDFDFTEVTSYNVIATVDAFQF